MIIDIEDYEEHLKKEMPNIDLKGIEKIGDYKNDSEIYEVSFSTDILGKDVDLSYRILAGYLNFTEEELKNNFVRVAQNTINNKEKEMEE